METALFTANNVWMMICTALVFFMHLGFSFLEIGLTRQKNTVNILFKNFFVITKGILLYALGGFNLMSPGFEDGSMRILKFAGFGIGAPEGGGTGPGPGGGGGEDGMHYHTEPGGDYRKGGSLQSKKKIKKKTKRKKRL